MGQASRALGAVRVGFQGGEAGEELVFDAFVAAACTWPPAALVARPHPTTRTSS
jgi:predicted RNA polymerase sigma factor